MLKTLTLLILTTIVMASVACGPSKEELRIACETSLHWREKHKTARDYSADALEVERALALTIHEKQNLSWSHRYHATKVAEYQTKINEDC